MQITNRSSVARPRSPANLRGAASELCFSRRTPRIFRTRQQTLAMLETETREVVNHTGATQMTAVGGDAGRVATVATHPPGDSLSSRLIASRTSAPPSVAFVPWGEIGETGCPRNINNGVLPCVLFRNRMLPIPEPESCRKEVTLAFTAVKKTQMSTF